MQQSAGSEGGAAEELRDFMLVLRDALLMLVRWIERRYGVRK